MYKKFLLNQIVALKQIEMEENHRKQNCILQLYICI